MALNQRKEKRAGGKLNNFNALVNKNVFRGAHPPLL